VVVVQQLPQSSADIWCEKLNVIFGEVIFHAGLDFVKSLMQTLTNTDNTLHLLLPAVGHS